MRRQLHFVMTTLIAYAVFVMLVGIVIPMDPTGSEPEPVNPYEWLVPVACGLGALLFAFVDFKRRQK